MHEEVCVRRFAKFAAAAGAVILIAALNPARADSPPPTVPDEWSKVLTAGADTSQQLKLYPLVAARPMSENASVVPWLQRNTARLHPFFVFELSRRLFVDNRDAALEWFAVGRIRLAYDAFRCADPSVGGDGLAIAVVARQVAGPILEYTVEHPAEYLAALQRVEHRSEIFDYDTSPRWICGHGLNAYKQAMGLGDAAPGDDVKPPAEWGNIRTQLLEGLAKAIDQLQQQIADAAATANDPNPLALKAPEAVLAGPVAQKISTIGAEARTTRKKIRDKSDLQLWRLMELADAEINAGDTAGAHETLAEVTASLGEFGNGSCISYRGRLVPLWVRSGDMPQARALVEGMSDPMQKIWALGNLGETLAKAGDVSGARVALDEIQAASAPDSRTHTALEDRCGQAVVKNINPMPSIDGARDVAVKRVGIALAQAGDFSGAQKAVAFVVNESTRATLLAEIALGQCRSGQRTASDALGLALAAARAVEHLSNSASVSQVALAFAACHDLKGAIATAHELAPANVQDVLREVARKLTEQGDYAQARDIDAANTEGVMGPRDVIALARRQITRGDVEAAKQSLARASALVRSAVESAMQRSRPLAEVFDASQPAGAIIDLQISIGAFADAIATSEAEDRVNRWQYFVRIIEGEAKRRDSAALAQTLPVIMGIMRDGDDFPATYLIGITKALGRAGFVEKARETLMEVQAAANRQVDGGRPQALLGPLAEARAAMGEVASARALLESQEPRFRRDLLVGFATELLQENDIDTALAIAGEIEGTSHIVLLTRIAAKQSEVGDLNGAMRSVWQITDPGTRFQSLVALLKSVRRL